MQTDKKAPLPIIIPWQRMRIQAVAQATGLGKSTIWQWVKENRFPKPYKLAGRITVWNAQEVENWLANHEKASTHA